MSKSSFVREHEVGAPITPDLAAAIAGRLTLDVPEAGRLLGLGRNAAYDAARRGEIPVLRIGQRLLVPVPRLLELVGYAAAPLHPEPGGVDDTAA